MNNIKWNLEADDINYQTTIIIEQSRKLYNDIIRTQSNPKIISMLNDDLNRFNIFHNFCGFLQFVSPDPKIRKASGNADLILSKYINELNTRDDVYSKLLEVKKNNVDPNDLQFVNKLILNYQRNGINLNDGSKQTLLKINHEISKMENMIIKFINESENNYIKLTSVQLEGIPNAIINTFEKLSIGIYNVQFNKTNYAFLMKYVNDSQVRKFIESSYSVKFDGIIEYLSKLIVLRDKHAKILSYECYSDFKSHTAMTKNSGNIKNFLVELLHKLDFRYKREIDTLMKIMVKDNNHENVNSWDIQYYMTKWKQEYGINDNSLKEYFEMNNTLKMTMEIYQKLFGIKFSEKSGEKLWCDKIVTYAIYDNNKIIGYLHMDLLCRNGKYKQTRCYCLQPATYDQTPIICLVASFGQFLNFHEVIALFHEFGHILHHIFGKTKYSIFSGTNVESDFVETPAQILDLLCWEKDIIKQLSKHYKNGKCLDDDIIGKLIKMKNLDIGLHYKKHILIALFDQVLYSSDKFIDACEDIIKNNDMKQLKLLITSLYNELHEEIMTDNNGDFKYKIITNEKIGLSIDWVHSLCESDSQYYSFIWSRVLSSDIYSGAIKGKQLNSDIGNQLKKKILSFGGTKSAYDMICDYINRKPAIDGFINMHDLDVEMEYSFFLNTDQIGNYNIQNKQQVYVNNDDYIDSVSNRFSEVHEYSATENIN